MLTFDADQLYRLAVKKPKTFYNHPDLEVYFAFTRVPDRHPLQDILKLYWHPDSNLDVLRYCGDNKAPIAGFYGQAMPQDVLRYIGDLKSYAKVISKVHYNHDTIHRIAKLCYNDISIGHLRRTDQYAGSILVLRAKNFIGSTDFLTLLDYVQDNSLFCSYNYIQSIMINHVELSHEEILLLYDKLRQHYKRLIPHPKRNCLG